MAEYLSDNNLRQMVTKLHPLKVALTTAQRFKPPSCARTITEMKQKKLLVNITILRGLLALTLGVLLLIQPVTVRPFAINFIGIYWLLGGIVSLNVAKKAPRAKGLRMTVGIMSIVAGLALLTRTLTVALVSASTLMLVLGVLIILSGFLHALAGIRLSETIGRGWQFANVLLGIFEIGFGFLVTLFPWFRFESAYFSIAIWAFLGGIIMLGDGLRLRSLLREQAQAEST